MTVAKRLICAVLLAYNQSISQAASFSGVCEKSARKYRNILESGDASSLLCIAPGGREGKLESVKGRLLEEIDNGVYKTLRQICLRAQEMFGVKISRSGLSDFLRRNGYRKLRCASLPAKAEPAAQRKFYCDVLLRLMLAAKQNELVLLFMDAVHFVYGSPTPGAVWTRERRPVKTASGRMRHNILAAVDFVTKGLVTVTNDTYIAANEVMGMLKKLANNYVGKTICVVLDNARYQHCNAVMDCANQLGIALAFLPPYSPNLNLIERLWRYIKGKALNAAYQDTFDKFKLVIHQCLDNAGSDRLTLDTLINYKVQLYDDHGFLIPFDNLFSYNAS